MQYQDKKILLVEDDTVLRNTLVPELALYFTVLTAKDGAEAWEIIQSARPDAIVLDLLLPKLDGFQVLSQLRSSHDPELAKTPVLVLSNLDDPQSIMKAEKVGIQGYFPKSEVSVKSLVTHIENIFS